MKIEKIKKLKKNFYFIFLNKLMMKRIIANIINRTWFNIEVKPLGRWQIDYCDKKINIKLDMSNEDHCGICTQYLIKPQEINNNPTNKIIK